MPLRISDTVGQGKRAGANTVGSLARKVLGMRFNTADKNDLRVEAGWEWIFMAVSLSASDEERMIKAEEERDQDEGRKGRVRDYLNERKRTCQIVNDFATLGYYAARAWTLHYVGGDYGSYKSTKDHLRKQAEECKRRWIDALPLDCKR